MNPPDVLPAAAIVVEGLTKRYGEVTAVDDLSFAVRRGAVTGFLSSMADAAPGALDAAGGILEVVDAAEILEAAASILGALIEGIGDL